MIFDFFLNHNSLTGFRKLVWGKTDRPGQGQGSNRVELWVAKNNPRRYEHRKDSGMNPDFFGGVDQFRRVRWW